MTNSTCCFFGHRKISVTDRLKQTLYENIEKLITEKGVDTFLFGSKSQFDSLCLDTVTKIKQKYPHIKRIYVRAEFPYIDDSYKSYLLESYDDTYYPDKLFNAGRAVYVERNCEMIDKSAFCIVYYDESVSPTKRKSGTKSALDYARKLGKDIVVLSAKE